MIFWAGPADFFCVFPDYTDRRGAVRSDLGLNTPQLPFEELKTRKSQNAVQVLQT